MSTFDEGKHRRDGGGKFANKRQSEAAVALDDSEGQVACGECGALTKRRSGLCRNCDPARKNKSGPNRGDRRTTPSVKPGVGVVSTKKGALVDTTQPSLDMDEIGQCEFEFVPVYKSGGLKEGEFRGCKNAVRLPAQFCHQHGGAKETSLGRTVAKAKAEAERGECFPLAGEHWDQEDERLAFIEGQLMEMLESDTAGLANAFVEFRRAQSEHGVGRFSDQNQMLVLMGHVQNIGNEHVDDAEWSQDETWAEAVRRMQEPHLTEDAWDKHGRSVTPGADWVATVWYQPGGSEMPDQEPGESDDDYLERAKEEGRFWRGKHGGHAQFPLSATEGEPFDTPPPVIDSYRPSGYGDATAARQTMTGLAEGMGIEVEFAKDRPREAVAYWHAGKNKIVVWEGLGGGDERAVVHALAHELGHARLGHSTDAQAEDRSPEKEMAAESFAALACAHHGIDSRDMSAWYVNDWRKAGGVNMKAGGMSALRSAISAFDEYVTATSPAQQITMDTSADDF